MMSAKMSVLPQTKSGDQGQRKDDGGNRFLSGKMEKNCGMRTTEKMKKAMKTVVMCQIVGQQCCVVGEEQ